MRKARSSFRYFPDAKTVLQLCHSSFAGPWPGMSPEELDAMRTDLLRQAEFCSIRILAFSIEPRAFHLLLECPLAPRLTKKDMLARIQANLSDAVIDKLLPGLRRNDPEAWKQAEGYFGSVGVLLKRVKHNAATRYHRQHATSGTLWNSRFEMAFVEPGHASRIVAAWIDHACTRETPGTSPENNPHCSIGFAVSGNLAAQSMIRELFPNMESNSAWGTALKSWRDFCHSEPDPPKPPRAGAAGPLLNRSQLLLHPLPHFHGGLAIGSHDFVERLFELNAHYFGDQRSSGARFLTGQNDPNLFTLRDKGDLRKPPRSQRVKPRG